MTTVFDLHAYFMFGFRNYVKMCFLKVAYLWLLNLSNVFMGESFQDFEADFP